MSLAFDKQGKPFTFQRRAKKLLVRLFRNPSARGTCCQVLGSDGQPLYVDPETDYAEFRKAVGQVPGLYRLDQCDEDGNELADAQPAYVSIDITRNAASVDSGNGEVSPLVIIQQMAAVQADVMKTMAAQQAALMAATAEILRAPYRPAPAATAELRNADANSSDRDDDADNEDEERTAPEHPVTAALRMLEPHLPQFGAFLYQQFMAFLKGRKSTLDSAPKTAATVATPVPTPPVAVETPVNTIPVQGVPAVHVQSAGASADVVVASESAPTSSADPHTGSQTTPIPRVAVPTPTPTPTPTPEQLAHLLAIREQLDPKERAIAEAAIARMDASTLTEWLAELAAMSVDEATALIRTMLADLPAA